jgi:hypothetical protein
MHPITQPCRGATMEKRNHRGEMHTETEWLDTMAAKLDTINNTHTPYRAGYQFFVPQSPIVSRWRPAGTRETGRDVLVFGARSRNHANTGTTRG